MSSSLYPILKGCSDSSDKAESSHHADSTNVHLVRGASVLGRGAASGVGAGTVSRSCDAASRGLDLFLYSQHRMS